MSLTVCPKCNKSHLIGKEERERGICASCEVASWSPEKKAAIGKVVSLGLKSAFGEPVPEGALDKAFDEAIKFTPAPDFTKPKEVK